MLRQLPYRYSKAVVSLLCISIFFIAACGSTNAKVAPLPTATATIAPTATVDLAPAYALALKNYYPVKLIIPKLNVSSNIEPVGTNASGAVEVYNNAPAYDPHWDHSFWWSAGAYPGQVGNSAIAAHVNRPTPEPGVFANLNKLVAGDIVQVQTANGTLLSFSVQSSVVSPAAKTGSTDPVIDATFGPADFPNLNLITCTGFDGKEFPDRLIVFTKLVGTSPFPPAPGTYVHK